MFQTTNQYLISAFSSNLSLIMFHHLTLSWCFTQKSISSALYFCSSAVLSFGRL